jgi:hypothetical protein
MGVLYEHQTWRGRQMSSLVWQCKRWVSDLLTSLAMQEMGVVSDRIEHGDLVRQVGNNGHGGLSNEKTTTITACDGRTTTLSFFDEETMGDDTSKTYPLSRTLLLLFLL